MLHKETVSKSSLDLLTSLQVKEYLKGYYLVGGTALSLMIGHRQSIDIDLFCDFEFDVTRMLENLSSDFSFSLFFSAKNTIKGSIDDVQVDILSHRYPLIQEPINTEGISMLSLPDIIAMKLNAITGSGQRVKDFIDIYYLLNRFSLEQMITYHKAKYKQYNEVNVLKSIIYFDDVDLGDWPKIIADPQLKWKDVKAKLEQTVRDFVRNEGAK